LRLGFLWIAIEALQGCDGTHDLVSPEDSGLTWHAARMLAIEDEYLLLWQRDSEKQKANPGAGKSIYSETCQACGRLIRARLSYKDLCQLVESCETLPVRSQDRQGGLQADILEVMVQTFVEIGDRDSLVELLSKRFVSHIGSTKRIELYLASQGNLLQAFRGNRQKDLVLVLGEAYTKCKIPEVRVEIAASVRRAFGLEIHLKDDAEFVAEAMRWYEENMDHLEVNRIYDLNELQPLDDSRIQTYDKVSPFCPGGRQPLFENTTTWWTGRRIVCVLSIWLIHAGIALILSGPIVFLGRKRVRWRLWELLAVILPFSIWAILMASELSLGRKGLGNLYEAFYLALGVPLAAIVRIVIGSRGRQQACAGSLIAVLCIVAVVVFFVVPPLLQIE